MIIDTSNAPCGPGFLPGLRLSEGRFAINRRLSRLRSWGCRRQPVCLRPPKCCRPHGCPVAVRRTRPRAPLRPEPPPLLYFPSFRVSPEARRGRHLRSSPHTPSRESGAAAGGLRVSELTALRARGRGRGPGPTESWVSQWKNRRTQKGRRLLRGGPRGHAGSFQPGTRRGSRPCARAT